MTVTTRRAIAAGAWAAVLLALAVTGPQWAFTPWFAAVALLLLAGLGAYALGLLDRHSKRHAAPWRALEEKRPRREPAAIEAAPDTLAEIESMGRLRETAGQRAGNWPMWQAQDTGICGHHVNGGTCGLVPAHDGQHRPVHVMDGTSAGYWAIRPVPEPLWAAAARADIGQDSGQDKRRPDNVYPQAAGGSGADIAPATVMVTDDPGGRHARPRAHPIINAAAGAYCSRCGRHGHWTGDDDCPGVPVTPQPASHAQQAIDDDLRAAGFKIYDDVDSVVDSIMMRALNGPLAIEAAKHDG